MIYLICYLVTNDELNSDTVNQADAYTQIVYSQDLEDIMHSNHL